MMFKNSCLQVSWRSVPVVLLLLSACGEKTLPPDPLPLVVTQRAVVGDAGMRASFAGEVRARSESALGFRVGGKITERLVDMGAAVKTGTPLVRMDARDLQLNAAAAKSHFAAAQAEWVQAQADYVRYSDLHKKNFVSSAELDRRKAALDVAQARLDQAKAQLNVAENQNAYAVLTADRDGVITAVEADVGQVVAAGQTVVRLARDAEKEIQIAVPENRLPEVKSAHRIDVTLWAAPEKNYAGKVREIAPGADTVTRTYAVRIAVAEADDNMRLGMTASVLLSRPGEGAAVVLPLTALYQQGTNPAVWIVESTPAGTMLKLAPVTVSAFREDTVIIASGVKTGELVVTAGVHKLTEGQKVRVAADAAARR
jgi:RND family efflux transporter MFP subunit